MPYKTSYCSEKEDKIVELAERLTVRQGIPLALSVSDAAILPRKAGRDISSSNIPYQGLGGVVDKDGNFIEQSVIYDLINTPDQKKLYAFGGGYPIKHIESSDKTAIYMGLAHKHWGHFLIDIVQRLWYPMTNGLLGKHIAEDVIFAFAGFDDGSKAFDGNYLEFFRLIGLDTDRIVFVNQPTQFKKVIVPDVAVWPGEFMYPVYKDIFSVVTENGMREVADSMSGRKVDKIYFSRRHISGQREMGEEAIERLMVRCGFTVMYPEELSLLEQIFYWQTAGEIACMQGTIPHNCVFARKDLKLYIFNKMERLVGFQFTMDAVWGNTPIYVLAYKEPFKRYPLTVYRGPFWITVTDHVSRFVKDYFGVDEKGKDSPVDWCKYILLCALAEIKYQQRGSKAKLKKVIRKLKGE